MQIVEPDRNPRRCFGRDDIGRGVADGDIGNLEVAGLEPVGPRIEHQRIELGQQRHQFGRGIVGEVRIGDVAFRAFDLQPEIGRAAAADLDRVAQPLGRSRLADQAQIGHRTACPHVVDQRQGAVFRRAFLVAGDDEADRAGRLRNFGDSGDHRRNRPLHIDRAAPVQQRAAPLGEEGPRSPALAGRDDIDVAGKGEMAAAFGPFADGKEVFHRPVGRLAGDRAVHGKAERGEARFKAIEHQARGRRDAGAGDQRFGQFNRVDREAHFCFTGPSYCSITQSSASAAATQSCSQSCSHTASI